MTITISYQYSSEYGAWDDNVDTRVVPNGTDFEQYCDENYPDNDGECGGYHFVEVTDQNGVVLFTRGEECSPC